MIGNDELQNRFGYHRATADSAPKHARVREECLALAIELDELLPDGRDKSLAMTALQETMHWANSAIAMQNDVDTETAHLPNAPVNTTNCCLNPRPDAFGYCGTCGANLNDE